MIALSRDRPAVYVLRVAGALDAHWAAWFAGLTMTVAADGTTTLAGPLVDQAALHGVLRKIRDLDLPLLSVERQDEPGSQVESERTITEEPS
jgi:hypothetical protein